MRNHRNHRNFWTLRQLCSLLHNGSRGTATTKRHWAGPKPRSSMTFRRIPNFFQIKALHALFSERPGNLKIFARQLCNGSLAQLPGRHRDQAARPSFRAREARERARQAFALKKREHGRPTRIVSQRVSRRVFVSLAMNHTPPPKTRTSRSRRDFRFPSYDSGDAN